MNSSNNSLGNPVSVKVLKGFSIYKNGKNQNGEDAIIVDIAQLVDGVETRWKITNGNTF